MLLDYQSNRESHNVMVDKAWRFFFERPVEVEEREIIARVEIVRQCEGGATKTNLIAAVMLFWSCSYPTAKKMVDRHTDKGLIASRKDVSNGTKKLYYIPEDVQAKVKNIEALQPVISAIVMKQKSALRDYSAGIDMLDGGLATAVYFNARDPKNVALLRENVKEQVKKIKEGKK